MSDETPRLKLAQLVSMQEMNNVTWNESLAQLDALVDLCLLGQFVDDPPALPRDGDAYLIGGAPTGAWEGYAYKIASCLDGAWRFHTPFNGLRAYVATTETVILYLDGAWTAIGSADFATRSGTQSLSNKTFCGATYFPGGVWDASGNVGLGTAGPTKRFEVKAGGATDGFMVRNQNSAISCSFFVNGDGDGYLSLYSGGGVSGRLHGNGDSYFNIMSGNLGIGTNSPSAFKAEVAGDVGPHAADTYNLGSASCPWKNGWMQNAWTVTSDENLKDAIAPLTDAEMAVAKAVAPLVVVYKMKAAVAEKGGAGARKHCGWIAQKIEAVFAQHGLDPFAYGCVGFDPAFKTVTKTRTVPDDGGGEIAESYEAQVPDLDDNGVQKTVHGIRPDEITAFALAGLAARLAVLEAR